MGTSGSFSGSGGKDARDLRDNIAGWLDGAETPEGGVDSIDPDVPDGSDQSSEPSPSEISERRPQLNLGPALRVLIRPSGRGVGSDGPGSGSGGQRGGSGGRSSGGATRSVGRISGSAGRAGSLALAYVTGDREALRQAGLNYDELRALGDPLEVGIKIVEATFESQANSTIVDQEERDIVADVVEWILENSTNKPLQPEEIVRKSIEITISEVALTEVTSTIHAKESNFERRNSIEKQIRDVAAEYAAQATLSPAGATEQEMAQAIENGIRDIGKIFGGKS